MLQKVCEQVVTMGVVKKSLHTWQRREVSSAEKGGREVLSQSLGSERVWSMVVAPRVMRLVRGEVKESVKVRGKVRRAGARDV